MSTALSEMARLDANVGLPVPNKLIIGARYDFAFPPKSIGESVLNTKFWRPPPDGISLGPILA